MITWSLRRGVLAFLGVSLISTAVFSQDVQGDFTIGGYLGVGTTTPERAVHLKGQNAVFRMDRTTDTAAFILVRTDPSGIPLKSFVVGVNASGANQGEFIINDIGAAVGGGGQRRMTITNSGDTVFGGAVTASEYFQTSSLRFKTNVRGLENPLATLEKLRGVRFTWRASGRASLGLVAEEVAEVLPEVVSWDQQSKQVMGINYDGLVALLVEATKSQQKELDDLSNEIDQLTDQVRAQLEKIRKQ